MNADFRTVIAASDDERRDLLLTTARRLGTAVQNVEKDFWVCWTLDVLFNGLAEDSPRLLFEGGTSLSKSFALIDRFSKDIDITVFRSDLGEGASVEELEALSGKKRRARLDAIKEACQAFIGGPLLRDLSGLAAGAMTGARIPADRYRIELDPADVDQQTLLFWYPAVTATRGDYVQSAVKIEGGAKSALDPNVTTSVRPYAADDLPNTDLAVGGITTVEAQRTFWDKVVILHGLRRWYDHRGQLRHGGQRLAPLLRRVPAAPVPDGSGYTRGPATRGGLRTPRSDVLQHSGLRSRSGCTGHAVARAVGTDAGCTRT